MTLAVKLRRESIGTLSPLPGGICDFVRSDLEVSHVSPQAFVCDGALLRAPLLGRAGSDSRSCAPTEPARSRARRAAEVGARLVDKQTLLSEADFVTIHLVLSARSRGLIGAGDLARMKKTAFLVNTSRGPIVDEAALIAALKAGTIAGVGLDVYDVEPLPAGHTLRGLPNAVLTPHLGYVTDDTYAVFYGETVEAVRAWLDGSPVRVIEP